MHGRAGLGVYDPGQPQNMSAKASREQKRPADFPILPQPGCRQGHVPASFTGMAARPPSYGRGNDFSMTRRIQKAGQMREFGGATMPPEPLNVDYEIVTGRFRFQGSQRRFLALSGKRAFGAEMTRGMGSRRLRA